MDINRGSIVCNKIIFIISLVLLANLSYADVVKNKGSNENKQSISKVKKDNIHSPLSVKDPKEKTEKNKTGSLETHSQVGVSSYLQMILGLFGVIVFILVIAWLAKRMGGLNSTHSTNLKVIAGLNVGNREKIIVVQVMDEQLLVGVTQTNIQLLSKLECPMSGNNTPSFGGFHEKLQTAISGLKKKNTENKVSGDRK